MPSAPKDLEHGDHWRNDELVEMTRQIMEVGPKVGEIARRMGIHKETLRYRFHRFIVGSGFVIQANLDYQKLGLKRLVLIASMNPRFEQHAVSIMSALSEMCYLSGFAQETLGGAYIMQVTVPAELREECARLYRTLRDIGVFTKLQVISFEQVRNAPMKAQYYDFFEGTWAYDWQGEDVMDARLVPSRSADVVKYDMNDLLILKELTIDANRTLVGISRKVGVAFKTLDHHYRQHIIGRGLIKSYNVMWQGTRYNPRTEKAESKRHTYLGVILLVTGTTHAQRAKLIANLDQLPFLWFEASDPGYYAEFMVPLTSYMEFLKRIRALAEHTGATPELFVVDQTKALKFTVAYKLYDQERKIWRLNSADIIARFENLMVNVDSLREEP